MCYPVKCTTCTKTTWAGCGQHIRLIQSSVPAAQWCPGHSAERKGGLFSRLFPSTMPAKATKAPRNVKPTTPARDTANTVRLGHPAA